MNVWKYEIIISRVEQDISLIALLSRETSWLTLEIDFIFPHIHVLFSIVFLMLHRKMYYSPFNCHHSRNLVSLTSY